MPRRRRGPKEARQELLSKLSKDPQIMDRSPDVPPKQQAIEKVVRHLIIKEYTAFSKVSDEENPNQTGNPTDVDNFVLGREGFNLLKQIVEGIEEHKTKKSKAKAKALQRPEPRLLASSFSACPP